MASEICADVSRSDPAKSAMVRATFKVRSYARALSFNSFIAILSSSSVASPGILPSGVRDVAFL